MGVFAQPMLSTGNMDATMPAIGLAGIMGALSSSDESDLPPKMNFDGGNSSMPEPPEEDLFEKIARAYKEGQLNDKQARQAINKAVKKLEGDTSSRTKYTERPRMAAKETMGENPDSLGSDLVRKLRNKEINGKEFLDKIKAEGQNAEGRPSPYAPATSTGTNPVPTEPPPFKRYSPAEPDFAAAKPAVKPEPIEADFVEVAPEAGFRPTPKAVEPVVEKAGMSSKAKAAAAAATGLGVLYGLSKSGNNSSNSADEPRRSNTKDDMRRSFEAIVPKKDYLWRKNHR